METSGEVVVVVGVKSGGGIYRILITTLLATYIFQLNLTGDKKYYLSEDLTFQSVITVTSVIF